MNINPPSDSCAAEILEVVPQVMRTIRGEMRQRRTSGLTVPQFRAMICINRQGQAALVEVAEYLGLTSATTCRMVDDLVGRGLAVSRPSTVDRRRIAVSLTPQGCALLEQAHQGTLARLEELLSSLSPAELAVVSDAIHLLRDAFNE